MLGTPSDTKVQWEVINQELLPSPSSRQEHETQTPISFCAGNAQHHTSVPVQLSSWMERWGRQYQWDAETPGANHDRHGM